MPEASTSIETRTLLDGLGQGILVFDTSGKLILDNLAAYTILGSRLLSIRTGGWSTLVEIVGSPDDDEQFDLNRLREQAARTPKPIRFHVYFGGAYIPCWIASVYTRNSSVLTAVSIERPDWQPLTELLASLRSEARTSLSATRGHAELIQQILQQAHCDQPAQRTSENLKGFTKLIISQTLRLQNLITLMHRLEMIRTGELRQLARSNRRMIQLADFIEDLAEEFSEDLMNNPDTCETNFRDRFSMYVSPDAEVPASPHLLSNVLRDILQNAVCYSKPETPIELHAYVDLAGQCVQIDVIDQGYGIRQSEAARVFLPFARARQPQIMGVDGYGLSLYLARAEIEMMGGSIWFESAENHGSVFSFRLPVHS